MKLHHLLTLASTLVIASCNPPSNPSYGDGRPDPFPTGGTPATVTSVTDNKGFAGDEIVITGSGFKTAPNQTMLNIGIATATITSITETEIQAIVPINASGDQRVRVATWGAEQWSNELNFTYLKDFLTFDLAIANAVGIAVDDAGNLYIGSSNLNQILRLDVIDSTLSVFASANVRGPMEFGPGGDLYYVSSTGIDRVSADGATTTTVLTQASVQDFDWHSNGDLYFIIANRVRRISNGVVSGDLGTITQGRRIRVFEGVVYVTEFTQLRVSKFEILETGLLSARTVAFQSNTAIQGVEFDANGNMYISGYTRDYVFKAAPDRENDGVTTQIPSEEDRVNPFRRITTTIGEIKLDGSVMYLTQVVPNGQISKIFRIFINEKNAPRHGRD
jgi:hypothetical protein